MSARCPEFDRLRMAARLESPQVLEHVRSCEACAFEFNELQQVSQLLRDLGRSEAAHVSGSAALWSGVSARLEQPRLLDRVPLPLSVAARLLGVLTQPAAATAWATGIAGVLLGLWLAPDGDAEPAAPYSQASLLEGTEAGLIDMYAESFTPDGAVQGQDAEDSTGAPRETKDDSL